MEDVRHIGFQMADKKSGLDFDHTKLVLIELAKIHALSWGYKKRHSCSSLLLKYPYLVDTCFSKDRADIRCMATSNMQLIHNIVSENMPTSSRALKSIEKIQAIGP